MALVTFVLLFLGGGLADDIFDAIGLGSAFGTVWWIARWPLALLGVMTIYAVLYFAAPNVDVPRFRWLTPGAIFGVLVTILASGAFFFYVSNFSSYSATYGAFAGAVILLIWLWLANVVLLFGAELNAVIDLRRTPELPEGYDGPPLPAKVPADCVGLLGAGAASSAPATSTARRGPGTRRTARGAGRSATRPALGQDALGEGEQRVRERGRVARA